MAKITLALITKNNEDSLKRCFYPIKKFLSEILAIDIGSTDKTLSILKEYGVKIVDFKFENDFSGVKNKLTQEASGDYILFLNPEEVVFEPDMQKLIDYLKNNPNDEAMAYMFYVRNYTNNTSARGFKPSRVYAFEGYFTSEQVRLIKNKKEIKFSFAMDESLMPCLDKMQAVVKHIIDVPIHNYNFQSRAKMLESLSVGSSDIRALYNAAIGYLNSGEILKAKENLQKVVEKMPSYKKAMFNLGSIYMSENKFETAAKMFQQCLESDDKTTGAYHNLGLIFQRNKQFDKAEVFLKKALTLEPEDFRIYQSLALLYKEKGNKEVARRAINSALKFNPQDTGLLKIKDSLV